MKNNHHPVATGSSRSKFKLLPLAAALVVALGALTAPQLAAQSTGASTPAAVTAEKPYYVEWVYRTKYGFKDEWWAIFKKYQIASLDKQKELGYVTDYQVFVPGLHTSEDSRWDYRIVITYKNQAAAGHGREVVAQLFPDKALRQKEENRRWELTTNHWDLPIRITDPHAD